MEIDELLRIIVDDGSRIALIVAIAFTYLRVTNRAYEQAMAQARATAELAKQDLKEYRDETDADIDRLKEELDEMHKELRACRDEAFENMRNYQKTLHDMTERAQAAELIVAKLEARIASLESAASKANGGFSNE